MKGKVTVQKQKILEAIKPGEHIITEDLVQRLRKMDGSFSRATTYRNLKRFAEEGKIGRVSCFEGADRYELELEPHYHIICTQCGKIENVKTTQIATPKSILGFEVTGHTLAFYGICPACLAKRNK